MNFSVLISCYHKDKPEELAVALKSIWDDQSLKPAEIVIVKDGTLTPALDSVIEKFAVAAPVKICALPQNMGLGPALAHGVEACSCDYIARMDSDDISLPDRFQKQICFLQAHPEVEICGGMIQEFTNVPEDSASRRLLPEKDKAIQRFARKRCPFNHVTVIYKKQTVLNAGNYKHLPYYEDYWLWARILQNGTVAHNLPDTLVFVRTGKDMLKRRRGWIFFKSELTLANNFYRIGFLNFFEYLRNITLRSTVRLLPLSLLRLVYKTLRKEVISKVF